MLISDCSRSRNNNFNLIRMLAAFAVLIEHSIALVMSGIWSDAEIKYINDVIGKQAIDVFFVTSGFLITASLLNRRSSIDFFAARILRIYPALLIVLFLSVFVIGPIFTTLTAREYFSDPQTFSYLLRGIVLLAGGVDFFLPGVFTNNPLQGVVNGSLWTIPFEVIMYLSLGLGWLVLVNFFRKNWMFVFKWGVMTIVVVTMVSLVVGHFHGVDMPRIVRLSFMFFTGSLFYLFREYVILSKKIFVVAIVILVLAGFFEEILFITYLIVLPYILFYFAYVPDGIIRQYNKLGDYSYGVYIYSFPLQQIIIFLMPNISVLLMFLMSGMISITAGIISWHFIEKKALSMKTGIAAHIQSRLKRPSTEILSHK